MAVIDNDFPFTEWHKKWANRHMLPGKIYTSVTMRYFIELESIFFFKVTPTMIQGAFEISFQQDNIFAILPPMNVGIIDVLIQFPKTDNKIDSRIEGPAGEHQHSQVASPQPDLFV